MLRNRGLKPYRKTTPLIPYAMLAFTFLAFMALRTPEFFEGRLTYQKKLKLFYAFYKFWRQSSYVFREILEVYPKRPVRMTLSFMIAFSLMVNWPLWQARAGDTGIPAGRISDSTYLYYIHGDHLGSAHILTEGNLDGGKHSGVFYRSGDLLQRIEYTPFGQEKFVLNPNLSFSPSYTGQKYDIETGLYFYKSRYYDPKLGRFIQPDTIVPNAKDMQSYNRYAYVRNNPMKYVDPSGHSFWGVIRDIGGFIGSVFNSSVEQKIQGGPRGPFNPEGGPITVVGMASGDDDSWMDRFSLGIDEELITYEDYMSLLDQIISLSDGNYYGELNRWEKLLKAAYVFFGPSWVTANSYFNDAKGYADINFTFGSPLLVGITFGTMYDYRRDKWYVYGGSGMATVGPGVSVMLAPYQNVTPGLNIGNMVAAGLAFEFGNGFYPNQDGYIQIGVGTPGASQMTYEVIELNEVNDAIRAIHSIFGEKQ